MANRRKAGARPDFLTTDNRVPLLVPVSFTVGEERHQLSELQLRRLTAAEMMIMDESLPFTEKVLRIVEAMTGQLRIVTIKLDAVDVDRIDDVFGYFMEPGSVTGATS